MSVHAPISIEASEGWQPRPLLPGEIRFGTWIAFFAWVFAVYDFVLFGTLLPKLGVEFGWSLAHQAAIATWIATGTAVVALLIGPLVDRSADAGASCSPWEGLRSAPR